MKAIITGLCFFLLVSSGYSQTKEEKKLVDEVLDKINLTLIKGFYAKMEPQQQMPKRTDILFLVNYLKPRYKKKKSQGYLLREIVKNINFSKKKYKLGKVQGKAPEEFIREIITEYLDRKANIFKYNKNEIDSIINHYFGDKKSKKTSTLEDASKAEDENDGAKSKETEEEVAVQPESNSDTEVEEDKISEKKETPVDNQVSNENNDTANSVTVEETEQLVNNDPVEIGKGVAEEDDEKVEDKENRESINKVDPNKDIPTPDPTIIELIHIVQDSVDTLNNIILDPSGGDTIENFNDTARQFGLVSPYGTPPPPPTNYFWFITLAFVVGGFLGMKAAKSNGSKKKNGENNDPVIPSKWLVINGSEIGESHQRQNPPVPCQDANKVLPLDKNWGIAVVCDGAGSAQYSDIGSEFITREATKLFKHVIEENNWIKLGKLPTKKEWSVLTNTTFNKLKYNLNQYSIEQDIPFAQLACTVIVVIYSPLGVLCCHIGDGRAGYRNKKGDWKSIMTPHRGEEANHTVFLTSEAWQDGTLEMNGVMVPESIVINDPPTAFTLLSDGCEYHCFKVSYFDKVSQKIVDLNEPHKEFFDETISSMIMMRESGMTQEAMETKWSQFLQKGTEDLEFEADDKTMIVGVMPKYIKSKES